MGNAKPAIIGVICAMLITFILSVGGRIEGYFFPVVVNTQITSAEGVTDYSTRISGQSDKLRECDYDSLVWYSEGAGVASRISIIFEERTKRRQAGVFFFGPWVLNSTEADIRESSRSSVFHRCHPLWRTETAFYGPNAQKREKTDTPAPTDKEKLDAQ